MYNIYNIFSLGWVSVFVFCYFQIATVLLLLHVSLLGISRNVGSVALNYVGWRHP